MCKKILIVGSSFYPQNSPRSFRTTELAKEFSRQGNDVTVLIPKNDVEHPEFEEKFGVRIKDIGTLRWRHADFGKSKLGRLMTRASKRILSLFFEFPDIELLFKIRKALKKEHGYDLLISIAVPYPNHWGVASEWRKNKNIAKTWVADCGDPFMGNRMDSFNKPFYFMYVEKWFMRKTDYVAITKKDFAVNYYPEFHPKMVEIPQGFNFNDVKIFDSEINNSVPTFAFAGGLFSTGRNPSVLLDYLVKQPKDFKFILYTRSVDLVSPYLEKSEGRIEVRDYIPRSELLYNLSQMDFLVNFEYNPKEQSPSKLIDYGLCKRPVLNIISKDFNPEVVDQFLDGNYENQFEMPDMDQYKIENVCDKFLSLIPN